MFHLYEFVTYFFTIVGATIADSWLGHYKTIITTQLIFFIGATIVAVGTIEPLHLPIQWVYVIQPNIISSQMLLDSSQLLV